MCGRLLLGVDALANRAELVSPLSGRMVFRGRDDLRVLLGAVYSTLRDLRWRQEVGDRDARVLIGDCRVGPLRMSDAMAFELAEDGRIRRIRPHLRPWLATPSSRSCSARASAGIRESSGAPCGGPKPR